MAYNWLTVPIRELGTDNNVGATQGTHYFKYNIPRLGYLSELLLTVYNPGKASNTFYTNEIRIKGLSEIPVKCSGIPIQKLAKFVYGREQGTSSAAGNAQMLDKITPHTAQTVGANACYFNYRIPFGRFPGDTQYGLNLGAYKNDPVFEADLVIAGADLDTAPQMTITAKYYYPSAPLKDYFKTIEIVNEATGTGKKIFDLEQVAGLKYEGIMATFTAVTTADAGLHGIYADQGKTPIVENTFVNQKILNGSDFSIPFAEIEAVGTADTYAYYTHPGKQLMDSMAVNNMVFVANRGTTTTLTNLSYRAASPNP